MEDSRIERIKRLMGTEPMPARLRENWTPFEVTDAMVSAYVNANGGEVPEVRQGLEAALRAAATDPGVILMTRELFDQVDRAVRELRDIRAAEEAAEDERNMFRGQ